MSIVKILIGLTICIQSSMHALAQSNALEAKAAYLLAEEAFEGGKYEDCIAFLDESAQKLGAANAKMLYLKIMALQVLAKQDYARLVKLIETVNAFEVVHDIATFNEEKQLEIAKLKLKLSRQIAALPTNKLESFALQQLRIMGSWKLGMSLEELKELYPEFFTENVPVTMPSQIQYTGIFRNIVGLRLTLQNNLLVQIDGYFVNTADDKDFTRGKKEWEILLPSIVNFLGKSISDTSKTNDSKTAINIHERDLIWKEDNIQFGLHFQGVRPSKGVFYSYAYMSVSLKP